MNKWDVILSLAILLIVILAIVHSVRVKRRGGCSCGCGGCTQCDTPRKETSGTEKRKP